MFQVKVVCSMSLRQMAVAEGKGFGIITFVLHPLLNIKRLLNFLYLIEFFFTC